MKGGGEKFILIRNVCEKKKTNKSSENRLEITYFSEQKQRIKIEIIQNKLVSSLFFLLFKANYKLISYKESSIALGIIFLQKWNLIRTELQTKIWFRKNIVYIFKNTQ